jgi:hypothetical protein
MIGLTDTHLKIVVNAARLIPVEKRDTFLQRIAAMLALRGAGRFTDTDVADVAVGAGRSYPERRQCGVIVTLHAKPEIYGHSTDTNRRPATDFGKVGE